jgi:hypothetical protein
MDKAAVKRHSPRERPFRRSALIPSRERAFGSLQRSSSASATMMPSGPRT